MASSRLHSVVPPFVCTLLYVICWYYTSSKNAVATQRLVQECKYYEAAGRDAVRSTSNSYVHFQSFPEMIALTELQLLFGLCITWPMYYILSSRVKAYSRTSASSSFYCFPLPPLLSDDAWKTGTGIAVGVLHFIGCLCTNMGFALGSASVVQVIKLLEPIETMILTAFANVVILKINAGHGITMLKALSVLIIVTGTAMLLAQKSTTISRTADANNNKNSINPVNYHSVFFALCSGFAMASRNVLKKILLPKKTAVATPSPQAHCTTTFTSIYESNNGQGSAYDKNDNQMLDNKSHIPVWIESTLKGLSNFFSITAVAAVPATLCFLMAESIGPTCPQINENKTMISTWILTSKSAGLMGKESIVFHGLYNLSSISVLGLISAQSHSILNVGKRIVNVLVASIAFQEPIGAFGVFGLCIAAVGGILYSFGHHCNFQRDFVAVLPSVPSGSLGRRYLFIVILGLAFFAQIFSVDLSIYKYQNTEARVVLSKSSEIKINQQSRGVNGKYAVWMFPFPPSTKTSDEITALMAQESITVICAYTNACETFKDHIKINLRELTRGTYYHNYIRDQAYHKLRHMNDFPYHIQAITMLALLLKNSDQEGENVCVRILGGKTEFCDAEAFSSYDPYEGDALNTTQFPFVLFNDDHVSERSRSLSLAPREMLTTERFALSGVGDIAKKHCTIYNSGEDVQSYASSAWLPFISEIRGKAGALQNFDGYFISNAYLGTLALNTTEVSYKYEIMKKISLLSIFSSESGIQAMDGYLRNYTNMVQAFGSRSTLTDSILKKRKIKSYFSACLTLTIDMQGAILSNDTAKSHYLQNHILKPNVTELPSPEQKTKIIFMDVVDLNAIPENVRASESAIYLNADIPNWYTNCEKKMGRYGYSYKLLSIYANQAKVIITSRIHAAMPATALGIPVIFVENSGGRANWLPGGKQKVGRVEGLLDLFHRVQRGVDGKNWTFGDLSGDIPHSDGVHLADRYRASFWNRLKKTHYYRDSAKMFGMVPFKRLGRKNIKVGIQDTFHFIMESELTWQMTRSIEHVFYFHPNCKIFVHSNTISPNELETFMEAGYNLVVQVYDLDSFYEEGLHDDFQHRASVPLLLLRKMGGVYLSKETLVTKAISSDIQEGFVLQENGDIAMAYYRRESEYVLESIKQMETPRNESESIGNLTWSFPVLSSFDTLKCIEDVKWSLGDDKKDKIAVSLHPSSYASIKTITFDTECYKLVEELCIFCDETHWDFEE